MRATLTTAKTQISTTAGTVIAATKTPFTLSITSLSDNMRMNDYVYCYTNAIKMHGTIL